MNDISLSKTHFDNSVENFSTLLSKTIACIKANEDDVEAQLKALWGTKDFVIIGRKQNKIVSHYIEMSKELTKDHDKPCDPTWFKKMSDQAELVQRLLKEYESTDKAPVSFRDPANSKFGVW